jgi:hypothetical protein
MAMKAVKRETFMEFSVVIGEDSGKFQAIGFTDKGKKVDECFGASLSDAEDKIKLC